MSDRFTLPGAKNGPNRSRSTDAAWPEEPGGAGPYDPLQSAALFDGVLMRRVIAYVLDGILLCVVGLIAWLILTTLTALSFGLLSPLMLILAVLPLAYHSLTIAWLGGTPGMCFLDVEVRLLNGARPDLPHAVLLTILFYATIWLTASLVLLVALFNRRGRCLHDMMTGVLVVRRSALHPGEMA